jgi:hypothetical protein
MHRRRISGRNYSQVKVIAVLVNPLTSRIHLKISKALKIRKQKRQLGGNLRW